MSRARLPCTASAILVMLTTACRSPPGQAIALPLLVHHEVRLDDQGELVSWIPGPSPYAEVARLAWSALETRFPEQDNGLPTYLAYSRFDPQELWGVSWPHNPAGLYAMLADSAVLWYAFSGDAAAIALAGRALDQQLRHGTTPGDFSWAKVPYASADPGAVEYAGADDSWCDFCGRGDGAGVVEPDKIGELGFGYLQMFEATGELRYRDAAVDCADALAAHVRDGDERHSPWPFRVYARTSVVREEYSANVVGAIALFDELSRLGIGDVEAYGRARAAAFDWMMRVPMQNDAWSGYFEDIEIQSDPSSNPNQYSAMRAARWLLQHPEADPAWRAHVAHLLEWVRATFAVDTPTELGTQYGALVLSEQAADMAKMGSHTARFGATTALWWEAVGDAPALDRAARSLAWATYTCDEHGIVAVGEDQNEGWWFSDGYGDYIRHFLVAIGAVPDWAPPGENHLLRSTSIVASIAYAPGRVAWTTFDADATDTLRLVSRPLSVEAAGGLLSERADLAEAGYTSKALATGGVVLRVRHPVAGPVVVTTSLATPGGGVSRVPASPSPGGCAVAGGAPGLP